MIESRYRIVKYSIPIAVVLIITTVFVFWLRSAPPIVFRSVIVEAPEEPHEELQLQSADLYALSGKTFSGAVTRNFPAEKRKFVSFKVTGYSCARRHSVLHKGE